MQCPKKAIGGGAAKWLMDSKPAQGQSGQSPEARGQQENPLTCCEINAQKAYLSLTESLISCRHTCGTAKGDSR